MFKITFIIPFFNFGLYAIPTLGNENLKYSELPNNSNILRISQFWLTELQDSYKIGFEKQFITIRDRNLSTVPNHNIPRVDERWCQNVSFLSVEQNKRLFEDYGYDSVLNSTIHEMLDNPRARLFNQDEYSGDTEDYRFLKNYRWGMCTDLIKLSGTVKSVFSFGKCIRLFEKRRCQGWSIAIFPGSSNSHRLDVPRHVTLKSIGPCLENEFSGGYLNRMIPMFVGKDPELRNFNPDLFMIFNPDVHLGKRKRFGGTVVQYSLGTGNRTEIIYAHPRWLDLDSQLNATVQGRDFHKTLEKEDGDVLGLAIPAYLGGPANETFNVFPANQSALNKWDEVLFENFKDPASFEIIWKFEYENENKTRPLSFYYWIYCYWGSYHNIQYGRIINGHRTNLRRARPFSQIIRKYEYLGTVTINLTEVLEIYKGISKIIESNGNNSFGSINKNTEIRVLSLQSCKRANMIDQELKETTTESSQSTPSLIQGMIQKPMVRLFMGENYTGDFEDYHIGKANFYKGCYDIKKVREIRSVATFGKCIRLFDECRCSGLSLAIYGKFGNSTQRIDKILKRVESVGPCLEKEITNESYSYQIKGYVVKNIGSSSHFPGLVQFPASFRSDTTTIRTNIVEIQFVLGSKNRTEYISAWITKVAPAEFSKTFDVEETEFYKLIDKNDGDIPCYAIPLALGGPVNESVNIFPTSQSKLDEWAQIFPSTLHDANEVFDFRVRLQFVYETKNCSRPQFVNYHFLFYGESRIRYGCFNNQ